jgi:hypothetical protein
VCGDVVVGWKVSALKMQSLDDALVIADQKMKSEYCESFPWVVPDDRRSVDKLRRDPDVKGGHHICAGGTSTRS